MAGCFVFSSLACFVFPMPFPSSASLFFGPRVHCDRWYICDKFRKSLVSHSSSIPHLQYNSASRLKTRSLMRVFGLLKNLYVLLSW